MARSPALKRFDRPAAVQRRAASEVRTAAENRSAAVQCRGVVDSARPVVDVGRSRQRTLKSMEAAIQVAATTGSKRGVDHQHGKSVGAHVLALLMLKAVWRLSIWRAFSGEPSIYAML
jgi:hypothetical protein